MNPYHQGQLDFFCAIYAFINSMRLLFGLPLNQARYILGTALEEISARPNIWNAMLNNKTDHHWVMPFMLGRFCENGQFPVRVAQLPAAPLADAPFTSLLDAGDDAIRDWLKLSAPKRVNLDDLTPQGLYRPDVEFGVDFRLKVAANSTSRAWNANTFWPFLRRWLPARKFISVFGSSHQQKRCLILRFHRYLPYQPLPLLSHWSTGLDFSKDTLNLFDCTANKDAVHCLPAGETAICPEELNQPRLLALEPQSLWFIEKV